MIIVKSLFGLGVVAGALMVALPSRAAAGAETLPLDALIDGAFADAFARCWSPRTSLLYCCNVENVKKAKTFKNGLYDWYKGSPEGYGAGIGDCAINDGVALSGCVDRWEALTKERVPADDPRFAETADWAAKLAQGLLNLVSKHPYKGFVARGLCEEDGKSICSLSSIDQHTHWTHGLFRYAHSPMAKPEIVAEWKIRIAEVAARMERTVKPETDYNFGMCDGRPDPRNICRMWWPDTTNATCSCRLPSIYAAAYDATGDRRWKAMYEKYAAKACFDATRMEWNKATDPEWKWITPTYTLLQMNAALEVLLGCEKDPTRRAQLLEGQRQSAQEADWRMKRHWAHPSEKSCNIYGMAPDAELDIAQFLANNAPVDDERMKIFVHDLRTGDPRKWWVLKTTHLFAAYWRARARGLVKPCSDFCVRPAFAPPMVSPEKDRKGNLVFNSSFELGLSPAGMISTTPFPEDPAKRPVVTVDETVAAHGKRSLKIVSRAANTLANVILPAVRFCPNATGAVYSAAMMVRADRNVNLSVMFSGDWIDDWSGQTHKVERYAGAAIKKPNEWRRCVFNGLAFPDSNGQLAIHILVRQPCTVWIDAVQFEKGSGTASDYAPSAPVEAAWTMDDTSIVAKDDGSTTFAARLNAISYGAAATNVTFKTTLGGQRLALEPMTPAVKAFTPAAKRFGVQSLGGENVYPVDFAVLPEVPERAEGFFLGVNGSTGVRPGRGANLTFRSLGDRDFDATVRELRKAGITMLRLHDAGLEPNVLYPERGKTNFRALDRLVDGLLKNGIEPMFVFGSTAMFVNRPWDDGAFKDWYFRKDSAVAPKGPMGKKRTYFLPKDADWDEMVKATVRHFKGRIKWYEIVNEPNITVATAADYLHYLKLAFKAIRAEDPKAKVVGICSTGDFGANAGAFVQRAGKLGAFDFLDVVSFHPYDAPVDNPRADGIRRIAEIRATCDSFRKGVPLLEDELYYPTWRSQGACNKAGFGPNTQERWWTDANLVRRYAIDLAGGAIGSVPLAGIHQLVQCGAGSRGGDFPLAQAGAFVPNGRTVASAAFARHLGGASFRSKPKLADGLEGFTFTARDGRAVSLVWAKTRRDVRSVKMPADAVARDLYGNRLTGKTLELTESPVYFIKRKK